MKKYYFLIIVALILGLVLTGCTLLSNIGQAPATEQSGIAYLTKGIDPDPGLVGLWHFDVDASDSSGNSNDGTVYGGASLVSGKFGDALSFDGIDDYVLVGDIGVTGDWTVEFWAKLASTGATIYYPIGLSPTSPNGSGIFLAYTGDKWGMYDGSGFVWGSVVSTDTWYHFAVTKSGITYTLYRDGAYEDNDILADIDVDDLNIGRRSDGYWYFDGIIDEVRIWSSVLTVDQLNDITPPDITIAIPAAGATYVIDEVVNADWITSDGTGTGVASETGPVLIDTTSIGSHEFIVTATDYAGNEGSASVTYYVLENFVTGGGKINMSTLELNGKKAGLTFGGTVGVLEGVGIVGQFHIVDHTGLFHKGAESWHCNNDFSFLNFEGGPAESPEATHDTAIFEGDFVSNRGNTKTLRLRIIDNGEPGARVDTFSILSPPEHAFAYDIEIDGGNFQVHNIDNED